MSEIPDFTEAPVANEPAPVQYTLALPFAIVVLVLISMSVRNILGVRDNNNAIYRKEGEIKRVLSITGQQGRDIEAIRVDLTKMAVTDPIAAQALADLFPGAPKAAVPKATPTPTRPAGAAPTVTDRLPPTAATPMPTTITDRLPGNTPPPPSTMTDRLPPPLTSYPTAQPPGK
jgi:hypothetical protein